MFARPAGMLAVLVPALLLLPAAGAGSGAGVDLELRFFFQIESVAREGVFPDGVNAVAVDTLVCNVGTEEIPWHPPMEEDHPVFAFLVAQERNGRLVQISDRSHVKHGFFPENTSCGVCRTPADPTRFLGVGCADVYSVQTNANQFFLAPPDELDPWTGEWSAACSLFDRGVPPVAPPADCDGSRSPFVGLGATEHRVRVSDADLDVPGAPTYVQGFVLTQGEPEANRENNVLHAELDRTWTGSEWSLSLGSFGTPGNVLERWSGATIASATNGGDDGRVYAAVRVEGQGGGLYRYEYALYNRDNGRGVSQVAFPRGAARRVLDAGFRDVDGDPASDWDVTVTNDRVLFTDESLEGNALRWNTIFNFWFVADAPPARQRVLLRAAQPGPGADVFQVPTTGPAPLASTTAYGCASPAGSLAVLSGAPTPGSTLVLGLDHPGGPPPGSATLLLVSMAPHPAFPCGGSWPQGGEILVRLRELTEPPRAGPTWNGPGQPASIALPIPPEPGILGAHLFIQGALVDTSSAPRKSIHPTEAQRLVVGLEDPRRRHQPPARR